MCMQFMYRVFFNIKLKIYGKLNSLSLTSYIFKCHSLIARYKTSNVASRYCLTRLCAVLGLVPKYPSR